MERLVASEVTVRFPQRIRGLVLVGPAGFEVQLPASATVRDVPLLGDMLFGVFGARVILEQNRKYFVDDKARGAHMPYYGDQLAMEGSAAAVLSTMRNSPVQSYIEKGYPRLGVKGRVN